MTGSPITTLYSLTSCSLLLEPTALAKRQEKLVASNNKPIPDDMVKPDLNDILDLRKKPLIRSELAEDWNAWNKPYTFFVEHLLPRVASVKGWKEET